jgi:cyanophycin synthetase
MRKNSAIIKKAVEEMGGTLEKIIPERKYFCINVNNEKIFISRKFEIARDFISGKMLTAYKDLTYVVFKKNNLPTPNSACFYKKTLNESDLKSKLSTLSFPIVVKDANGSNSKGVFVNIKSPEEAKNLIKREVQNFSYLIAQEMIFGKEYRVLILGKKAIGVLEMIPPRIFGDGKSTVEDLIKRKQAKKFERTKFDDALDSILNEQDLELTSIPEKDREVFIKKNSCLAEGGETKDVTELVHPSIVDVCAKAAKATGKLLAGLDIICDNIAEDINKQNFSILEINGKPDIYIHYNPNHGKTRNVVKDIIEFIIKLRKSIK